MPHGSVCLSRIVCSSRLIFSRSDEQLVELDLAEDGTQRRLRQLAGRVVVVLHLDDRLASGSITRK